MFDLAISRCCRTAGVEQPASSASTASGRQLARSKRRQWFRTGTWKVSSAAQLKTGGPE